LVLVGHRWVMVLVVFVVLGGTAVAVVAGGGIVDCVTWNEDLLACAAVGTEGVEPSACAGRVDVVPTESIATTAVAVTRGAATAFVAG
jgi:hypothetical protein